MNSLRLISKTSLLAVLSLSMILSGCGRLWSGKALTDLQKVERQVPIALEIINTLAAFAAPEYVPQVTAISAQIKGDLNELNTVIADYQNNLKGVTPSDLGKIQALVSAIAQDLPAILPALHVVDSESVKYANAVVVAVSTVLSEVALLLPQDASQVRALSNVRSAAQGKIITASDLRKQFNGVQNKVHIQ